MKRTILNLNHTDTRFDFSTEKVDNKDMGTLRAGRLLILGILIAAGVSCTKSGTVSSTGSSSVAGTLGLTKVFPTSQGVNWSPIVSSSRYYIKGLDLSVTGTCSRGVATIKVNEGGPDYSETASCDANGQFSFAKTYLSGAQGDKTLYLTGYGIDDAAIPDVTMTVDVRIDDTPPNAPAVTDPAANPFTATGNSTTYNVQGTSDPDVVSLSGPTGTYFFPSAGTWDHDITLIDGSSTDYDFYTYDLAGNRSAAPFTQTIIFSPSINVIMAGAFLGGPVVDTGTNYEMEACVQPEPDRNVHSGSSFVIETGFNFVTNTVRAE